MNQEQFINTGRITNLKDYAEINPKAKLHIDTVDVVVYKDGSTIEILKTGEFLYNNQRSKNLEDIENILWKEVSKKLAQ